MVGHTVADHIEVVGRTVVADHIEAADHKVAERTAIAGHIEAVDRTVVVRWRVAASNQDCQTSFSSSRHSFVLCIHYTHRYYNITPKIRCFLKRGDGPLLF